MLLGLNISMTLEVMGAALSGECHLIWVGRAVHCCCVTEGDPKQCSSG